MGPCFSHVWAIKGLLLPRPSHCAQTSLVKPLAPANFMSGNFDGETFSQHIHEAYGEVIYQNWNMLVVPRRRIGLLFVIFGILQPSYCYEDCSNESCRGPAVTVAPEAWPQVKDKEHLQTAVKMA